MRCFLAIELSDEVAGGLLQVAHSLRALDGAWAGEKWVSRDAMHLTLKFMGGIDEGRAERLQSDLRLRLAELKPFPLGFGELRAVPRLSRASLIWMDGDDPTGGCGILAGAAEAAALRIGVEAEPRPFEPHVTLVRARRPRPVAQEVLLRAQDGGGVASLPTMSVLSATLFSSVLTPTAPRHTRLAEFALGSGQVQ